ncbi:hypothetical protein PR048_027531 [Dryococelus australis]|uniref:Uncharacterized protein n=1 Tax=Dryococelus australis TaxID=614101 RepID=A0ABQ9GGS5_9NEOP|nr:hypothetical protein PR048_027531 [Dryococelus australis]
MPYQGFEPRTSRTADRRRTNLLRHGRSDIVGAGMNSAREEIFLSLIEHSSQLQPSRPRRSRIFIPLQITLTVRKVESHMVPTSTATPKTWPFKGVIEFDHVNFSYSEDDLHVLHDHVSKLTLLRR